jgi:hypothetical protein
MKKFEQEECARMQNCYTECSIAQVTHSPSSNNDSDHHHHHHLLYAGYSHLYT